MSHSGDTLKGSSLGLILNFKYFQHITGRQPKAHKMHMKFCFSLAGRVLEARVMGMKKRGRRWTLYLNESALKTWLSSGCSSKKNEPGLSSASNDEEHPPMVPPKSLRTA
jgi:hypothetical protein